MRVSVDADWCETGGQCARTAPEVFRVGPKGVSTVICVEPSAELRERVHEAARRCPAQAIMVADGD